MTSAHKPELPILLDLLAESEAKRRRGDASPVAPHRRTGRPTARPAAHPRLRRLRDRARHALRARFRDYVGSGRFSPGHVPVGGASRSRRSDRRPRGVRKITPWTAAAASTRRHEVFSVVGSGGSWSSSFVHAKVEGLLAEEPGRGCRADAERLVDQTHRRRTLPAVDRASPLVGVADSPGGKYVEDCEYGMEIPSTPTRFFGGPSSIRRPPQRSRCACRTSRCATS